MLMTPKAKSELFLASCLYDGLEDNNITQVTTLLLNKKADPNVLIPTQGITPFHLVIGNDSETFAEEVTKLFLRHGGNPNVRSADGMTPVHVAAAWGRVGILNLLLANGGDPLRLDDDGRSPFHYAFDGAYYNAIAVLGKYCGEAYEDDEEPKYQMAFDKVFVNCGDLVAKYIVSEESVGDTAASISLASSNFKEMGESKPLTITEKPTTNREQSPRKNLNMGSTCFSSMTDESSCSMSSFVTLRRHQRCLPKMPKKCRESKNEAGMDIDLGNIGDEKRLVSQIIRHLSESTTGESTLDESFLLSLRREGEQMPRVSSPKDESRALKLIHQTPEKFDNAREKETVKCLHDMQSPKTPCTIKKRAVTPGTRYDSPLRIDFKNELVIREDAVFAAETSKSGTKKPPVTRFNHILQNHCTLNYSPDSSIISQSPNLVITPTSVKNKEATSKASIQNQKPTSVSDTKKTCLNRTTDFTSGMKVKKTPQSAKATDCRIETPKSISRNNVISRACHSQKTRKKYESPRFKLPNKAWSLRKQKQQSPHTMNNPQIEHCASPLNKTFNKDTFNTVPFSPDVEIVNKHIDRKLLSKGIAVRLDESMYDEELNKKFNDVNLMADHISEVSGMQSASVDPLKTNRSCVKFKEFVETDQGLLEKGTVTLNINSANGKESIVKREPKASPRRNCEMGQIKVENFHSTALNSPWKRSKETMARNRCQLLNRIENLSVQSKDIDDSLLSTDDSIFYSDPGSKHSTSDNNRKSDDFVIEKKLFKCLVPTDRLSTGDLLPKSESSSTQSDDLQQRLSLENLLSTSFESLVSIDEEYKYKDAEKGVVLLERRLCVTPARVPTTAIKVEGVSPGTCKKSDDSLTSYASDIPKEMLLIDNCTLRQKLIEFGDKPGPITNSTFHVYLRRLLKLVQAEPSARKLFSPNKIIRSCDRNANYAEPTLKSINWMENLEDLRTLEEQAFQEFIRPDPTRRWREGMAKVSFNYLLLDSRATKDLPRRGSDLPLEEKWETFLSAIFYVGKGKRSRPFSHLYDAFAVWVAGKEMPVSNQKVRRILDIWNDGYGVISLHIFQNTIAVEAYTREAMMIEALGTEKLGNSKGGEYYGVVTTWSISEKRKLGKYLLYRAMEILMHEGERQLFPEHL